MCFNGNTNKNKCKRNKKASEQDKKASKQNNMRAIRFAFFCTYLRFVKVHFRSKDLSAFKKNEFIGPEFWNVFNVEFLCFYMKRFLPPTLSLKFNKIK